MLKNGLTIVLNMDWDICLVMHLLEYFSMIPQKLFWMQNLFILNTWRGRV